MKYNLHIHSKYSSDGILNPEKIVRIAITDHNTIKGGLEAKKYENEDFKVIVGSEISTDRGEMIGMGKKDFEILESVLNIHPTPDKLTAPKKLPSGRRAIT